MFPSKSAGECELVSAETVRAARKMTGLPIFLAGGISLQNVETLKDTGMNGVAVISSVLNAEDPRQTVTRFRMKLENE